MNSKQRKALAAVFGEPTSATVDWQVIERLLIAAGCVVVEGSGSRVRFVKGAHVASFHRPHPDKEAKRYQVQDARDFLRLLGIEP